MSRFLVPTLCLAFWRSVNAGVENITATVQCPEGNLAKCAALSTCTPTVIESVANHNWTDDCEGLAKMGGASQFTAATCKNACFEQFNCSVWQFSNYLEGVKSTKTPMDTYCYTGIPNKNCRTRSDFVPIAGERVQRGAVIVTNSSVGIEVKGLHRFQMDSGTEAEKVKRCKDACYTNVQCGVWQYHTVGAGASVTSNCHMERFGNEQMGVLSGTDFGKQVTAGEFVTHYCPTVVPEEPGLPWKWIIPAIILGLLALGAILYLLQPVPKTKKTRAVKIAPKEEPKMAPLFIPQPSILIPVQPTYTVVQQTQPTYTVQEPVYTVQQPMLQ